jgi:hypothetical protein
LKKSGDEKEKKNEKKENIVEAAPPLFPGCALLHMKDLSLVSINVPNLFLSVNYILSL